MRQRITYLVSGGSGIDPAEIDIGQNELTFARSDHAVEERRITLGMTDLPEELQAFLEDFHELHIRIASSRNYQAFSPAVSRIPAGLHVFFTPRQSATDTQLCFHLQRLLGAGVKCSSSSGTFSKPRILSERFSSASTYQFYHAPSDLQDISSYLQSTLCPSIPAKTALHDVCDILAAAKSAAYIDYDYDVISHALNIVIVWDTPTEKASGSGRIPAGKFDSEDRLEVGVLQTEKATEPEEISLGGYLTVVGDDDHPGATLFSFPARHHPLPSAVGTTFTVGFQSPTGLHPKADITFPLQDLAPPIDGCALHAYWTLPSFVFIDRYQFSDPLFLASQNLVSLRSLSGEEDLEAPDWAVKQWGSAALFELAHPKQSDEVTGNWTATVPMHLRYIDQLTNGTGGTELALPWPVVFWACQAEEGLKMATNPFDRVNLGYDGLFGPKTMFYHVPPGPVEELVERLNVPTMNVEQTQWVPLGTAVAVLLGFGWVLWQLLKPPSSTGSKKKSQ